MLINMYSNCIYRIRARCTFTAFIDALICHDHQFEVVPSLPEKDDCDRMSFHSAASHSPADAESVEAKFRDAQEKVIYEHQLNQLQEQLVAVMIDNQNLRKTSLFHG